VAEVAPERVACSIYDGLARLPAFNPDEDHPPLPPEVGRPREAIHAADAVIFSTPEYAGALPGSLKNLLDWTIGDDQAGSIYDKPVGWFNVSPRGSIGAHDELRTVLLYAHARIVDVACVHVPITGAMVGPDGLIDDEPSRQSFVRALAALSPSLASDDLPGGPFLKALTPYTGGG
jgi:NAD(P)H-dependent FMN reductase